MGPHLMHRPPKYIHGFIDRHGKPRFYFRRAGFKKVPLPGLPWSSQFMEAYERAVAGQSVLIDAGARRTKPGSMRALAVSYFQSVDYRSMQARTQRVYRGLIERFCEQADKDGNKFGDKRAALIGREHVVRLIATKADKPEAANQFRKVLRAMMKHAVEIGLRVDDPTRDVRSREVRRFSQLERFRDRPVREAPPGRVACPAGPRPAAIYRAAALGHRAPGPAACPCRRPDRASAKDRSGIVDPASPYFAGDSRRYAEGQYDIRHHSVRQAIHLERLRKLVPRPVQRSRVAAMLGARATQGGRTPVGGGRLHGTRDRVDHGPRESQASFALHESGRPGTIGKCGDGKGENANIEWLT
jgi:hypothetical protein